MPKCFTELKYTKRFRADLVSPLCFRASTASAGNATFLRCGGWFFIPTWLLQSKNPQMWCDVSDDKCFELLIHWVILLQSSHSEQALFTVLLFIFLLRRQVIFGKHHFRTFCFVFIALAMKTNFRINSNLSGLNLIKDDGLTEVMVRPYLNISTTGWGSCHVDLLRRSWSLADLSSRLWWSPQICTTLLVQYVYCWGHLLKFIVSSPVLSSWWSRLPTTMREQSGCLDFFQRNEGMGLFEVLSNSWKC